MEAEFELTLPLTLADGTVFTLAADGGLLFPVVLAEDATEAAFEVEVFTADVFTVGVPEVSADDTVTTAGSDAVVGITSWPLSRLSFNPVNVVCFELAEAGFCEPGALLPALLCWLLVPVAPEEFLLAALTWRDVMGVLRAVFGLASLVIDDRVGCK